MVWGGDVFGGEGSLASQHMDTAMKKSAAEGVSLRSSAAHTLGRMQADWPSGERGDSQPLTHTQTHTDTHRHTHTVGMDALAPVVTGPDTRTHSLFAHTHACTRVQMYSSYCLPAQRKTKASPCLLSSNFSLIKRGINFDLPQCSRSAAAQPVEKKTKKPHKPISIPQPHPQSQTQSVFHSFRTV